MFLSFLPSLVQLNSCPESIRRFRNYVRFSGRSGLLQRSGAPGLDFETWDKQTTLGAPSMRPHLPHGWEITKAKSGAPGLDFETWDKQTTLGAPSMRPHLPHGWEITKAKSGAPGLDFETWEGNINSNFQIGG